MNDKKIQAVAAEARKQILGEVGHATRQLYKDYYKRRQLGTDDTLVNSLLMGDKIGYNLAVGTKKSKDRVRDLREQITGMRRGKEGTKEASVLLGMHAIQAVIVGGFLVATIAILGSNTPYYHLQSNYKEPNGLGDALVEGVHDDGPVNMAVLIYVIYALILATCFAVCYSVFRAKKISAALNTIILSGADFDSVFDNMWNDMQKQKEPGKTAGEKAKKMLQKLINPQWSPKSKTKDQQQAKTEYMAELINNFSSSEYDDLTRFNLRRLLVFVTYFFTAFGVQTLASSVYQINTLFIFASLQIISTLSIVILLFQRYIRSTVKTYMRKLAPLEHFIVSNLDKEAVDRVKEEVGKTLASSGQVAAGDANMPVYYETMGDEFLRQRYPQNKRQAFADVLSDTIPTIPTIPTMPTNPTDTDTMNEHDTHELIASVVTGSRIADRTVLIFLAFLSVFLVAWNFFVLVINLDKTQGAIADAASLEQTKTLPAIILVCFLVLHLAFHASHWWLMYLWNNVADKVGFPLRKAGVDIFQMGLCIVMWGVSSVTYAAVYAQGDYLHYFA